MITDGIRGSVIGGSKDERKERQKRLVGYIVDTLHMHNMYAFGYFLCEFLNWINVVSMLKNLSVHLGRPAGRNSETRLSFSVSQHVDN